MVITKNVSYNLSLKIITFVLTTVISTDDILIMVYVINNVNTLFIMGEHNIIITVEMCGNY